MRGASAFSALMAVLATVSFAAAQPSDPYEAKKRADAELARTAALLETASAQAQAAGTRLVELNEAVATAKQRSEQARGVVAAAEKQAATASRKADVAKSAEQLAVARYGAATDRVKLERVRLGRFATVAYQGGEVAQFNAILGSSGPREFLLRASYARRVAELQKESVDGYAHAQADAMQTAIQAGDARYAASTALTKAQAALADAAKARDEALRSERAVAELVSQQQTAVAAAEQYRAEVLAQHEEALRESERIAAELAEWEAAHGGGPVLRPGARLLMPVDGWKSSDFGYRYHPIYHVWRLHTGTDFAAPSGQPIYAAADGTVAAAGVRGGYGNYTCVANGTYQGQRFSTCYAHQSRILVSVGQRVSRGQLIGRVGTTGTSTGNHLHFEVRLNGTPVNPVGFLPACLC
jgi:murein DD-endopeptidase MepM/ murein hydrolase activator NlpD